MKIFNWILNKVKKQNRGFNAAIMNRLTNDWRSFVNNINEDIRGNLKILRSRSRDLYKNNAYVRKYVEMCKLNIVGSSGFILNVRATESDGRIDEMANRLIEDAWWDWTKPSNCSVTEDIGFRTLCQLLILHLVIDGEFIVKKVVNKRLKYGFQLQVLDPELIATEYNKVLSDGKISMGIEFDNYNRPRYYYLKQSIDDEYSGKYVKVSADEIYHCYIKESADAYRGIPWITPVMYDIKMLKGYEEAALINARASASKMLFFKRTNLESEYIGDARDEEGNIISSFEPGSCELLPYGIDIAPFSPEYPQSEHSNFVKSMLRGIASGLGVSYNTLSNDLESVNYSSARVGLLEEREKWKDLQEWFIENFLNKVYADWLFNALLVGAINLPLAKYDKFNVPIWFGRRWSWVDPESEINAIAKAIELGLADPYQVAAEQGKDLETIYQNIYKAKLMAEKYNIIKENKNGKD